MVSRRDFVKRATAGVVAASGITAAGSHIAAAAPMDDSGKSRQARLMPGCCAYSYNEDLRHGAMTLEDFI